ncbi:hypothetical protein FQA47_000410 [Oryzias melastigma]|nr:hypothetical protein FQA47_000410 [Oryzias melastigma]
MRLQLIRYESVELTEQLMRERQKRQTEEDASSEHAEDQEMEEEPTAASEVQVELRGVLLEEQRSEELTVSAEEGVQEEGMLYVLSGGESSVLLQLQDTAQQQQGM